MKNTPKRDIICIVNNITEGFTEHTSEYIRWCIGTHVNQIYAITLVCLAKENVRIKSFTNLAGCYCNINYSDSFKRIPNCYTGSKGKYIHNFYVYLLHFPMASLCVQPHRLLQTFPWTSSFCSDFYKVPLHYKGKQHIAITKTLVRKTINKWVRNDFFILSLLDINAFVTH